MTTKTREIDYTKMALGTVTRTYQGRNVSVIARCPKCGRRGERSVSIPSPEEAMQPRTPNVSVHHLMRVTPNEPAARPFFGSAMRHVVDHCIIPVDKTNVDDLLNVRERKRYDAFRDALIARAERY